MATTTRTEFDQLSVERYRFALGHRPRGYGAWWFGLGRNGAWTDFRFTGNYTDAKKAAIREARSLGCDTVVVNS
jgi:hypothetical protein